MKSWSSCVIAIALLGCGAVFPEITPLLKAPPSGQALVPPPPEDLVFVALAGAEIPQSTRDGRKWDSMGGAAPDVFAKLFVDDKEIIRTPVQADTLKPTWPGQKLANYRISPRAHVRVELWDSNPINNQPICIKTLHNLPAQSGPVPVDVECAGGATVRLRVEPAHARWGLGFAYELRTVGAAVTRVFAESPAAREGLKSGDEILQVDGEQVAKMEAGALQSKINSGAQQGIELLVKRGDDEKRMKVKAGPVYPVVNENVPLE